MDAKKPGPKARVFLSYENKLSCRQPGLVTSLLQPITDSKLSVLSPKMLANSANRTQRPVNAAFALGNALRGF
jgi:hypothetical protein